MSDIMHDMFMCNLKCKKCFNSGRSATLWRQNWGLCPAPFTIPSARYFTNEIDTNKIHLSLTKFTFHKQCTFLTNIVHFSLTLYIFH